MKYNRPQCNTIKYNKNLQSGMSRKQIGVTWWRWLDRSVRLRK